MNNQISEIIFNIASYYDKKLTASQVTMYTEELSILTPQELNQAFKSYRSNPKNDFFPLPAKLIAIVKPEPSERELAQQVAARIIESISKFGPYQHDRAKMFIGDIGWRVVNSQGGWESFCELDTETVKQEQPRWRDLAGALITLSKAGKMNIAPSFESVNGHLSNQNQNKLQGLVSKFTHRLE